jgi:muconolactone D-isomerase
VLVDFLVHIDSSAVHTLPDREPQDLIEREWARAQSTLRKPWRLPGQYGNVGIWSARDADELTEALRSLPIWPLITLEVTPLATHPLFAEIEAS